MNPEEFYAEPDEALKARRLAEYRDRFIQPFFPANKNARITDLGAGYGLFLNACRAQGYTNIEGVERGQAFVEYARREFGINTIRQNDLFAYLEHTPDDSFDVITAFNVIEHVSKERVPSLLALIQRKLARGGVLIMEVPNADSPLGIHTYFSDLTHEFAYSRKLGATLLKRAGFSDVRLHYQTARRNPLIVMLQALVAKLFGITRDQLFSGNIVFTAHRNAHSD